MEGPVTVEKQIVDGNDPPGVHGYVCEGDQLQCQGK